jgi:hypothetical protein
VVISAAEQAAWLDLIAFASRGPIQVEVTTIEETIPPVAPLEIAPVEFPAILMNE